MKSFIGLAIALAAATAALALPAGARAGGSDDQLLRTYQPVLVFDPAERFRPARVDEFVSDSTLERFDGSTWQVVDANPRPNTLPTSGGGFRLDQQGCSPASPLGGLDCYATALAEHGRPSTVYGQVIRSEAAVVLEYWLFYYDDVYSYFYPPSDLIWQSHEGDWESIAIVLSPDGAPLEAAFSQHCVGQRRSWSSTQRVDGTHPVAYVAVGSHASYFAPGLHPLDPACVPAAALALLRQHGLPDPVDYAGIGVSEMPLLERINDGDGWAVFPGYWGELQYFHSPFTGTVPFGTAPVGPAFHGLWADPLATIAHWPQG
jgi:hypothetical protein